MFNFTSTNLINSSIDLDGSAKFAGYAVDGTKPAHFNVKKVIDIKNQDSNEVVYKKAGYNATKATAVLNLATGFNMQATPGTYRLAFYIRLSGSQNSFYSNDMVFKGKPLYFEFQVLTGDTDAQVVQKIITAIKLTQANYEFAHFTYAVTNSATTLADILTLTATDEYQLLTKAVVELYTPYSATTDTGGTFATAFTIPTTVPVEGFGTYTHLIKDYRIPTLEARRFGAPQQDELPVPGALYTQYVIRLVTDRGVLGGSAVGEKVTSITNHIFWVISTSVAAWDTSLGTDASFTITTL